MTRLLSLFPIAAVAALAFAVLQGPDGAAYAQSSAAPTVEEMSQGNPDAAVTVIEYASFTCPHCANFHNGPYQDLKADFIDTGKINFIYREVYFDRFGLWAGMLALCAGP